MRLTVGDPSRPGWTRRPCGRGFRYFAADGEPVRDADDLARLRSLAIPPAWREVWICPRPSGHLQAVGTDAAGRRQYLYHPEFRRQQEQSKHEHVLVVAERLPAVRKAVADRLATRGLNRERVLACAVRLLDVGFFRVGSDAYSRENGTYGLTTVLREHVTCRADEVAFDYPAKGARQRVVALTDPDVRKAVTELRRRRGGGDRLLAYWEHRRWHDVHSEDLNACLRELADVPVSAKDFRTWHATVLAAVALAVSARVAGGRPVARTRAVNRAVREVAHYLGNTPAVCRASYVNPRVVELFHEGVTVDLDFDALGADTPYGTPAMQGRIEDAVLRLLTR
jgi:DNA topoisomerase IB